METKKKLELHFVVENLIKIRNDRRLTQSQFCDLLEIDTSTYNKIENGNQQLSMERLSKFAIKLKMREIDIFTYPIKYVESGKQSEDIKAVLTIELKKDVKDQVLKLVFGNENIKILNE